VKYEESLPSGRFRGRKICYLSELHLFKCPVILHFVLSTFSCRRECKRTAHGTRRFITVFTKAYHQSMFWARWTQRTTSHTISLKSVSILSSHVLLGFQVGLCPSDFPTKILSTLLIPPSCHMTPPSHPPWFDRPNIWRLVQITKLCIMQLSLVSSVFLPLRSEYSQTSSFCYYFLSFFWTLSISCLF
jgi:hypothetical protein